MSKARGARVPSGEKTAFDPRIVVFACNWCSYAGADTAGVSRIAHEPHFRMIRVMCSGRIQPGFVLRAFEKGADGVLVSGCHFGDCHYVFGNHRAQEQFEKTRQVLHLLGLGDGRLRLEWISAAEGARFAQVINEFTEQVRQLGPSPLARLFPEGEPLPSATLASEHA
jgi:F420-non-reducing hydrogenase iron-sulfur subunit